MRLVCLLAINLRRARAWQLFEPSKPLARKTAGQRLTVVGVVSSQISYHRYYAAVRLLTCVHAHRSAAAFMGRSGVLPDTDKVSQVPYKIRDMSPAWLRPDCDSDSVRVGVRVKRL